MSVTLKNMSRQAVEAAIDLLLAKPDRDYWEGVALQDFVIGCGMTDEDGYHDWLSIHEEQVQ